MFQLIYLVKTNIEVIELSIEYLCNLVVKNWVKRNVITAEYEEWYTFGLYSFVSGIINISIFIILGIILGCLKETLVFMVSFILSREFMGGYHCDTALRCKLFSTASYLIIMAVCYYNIIDNYILYLSAFLFITGNIVIYLYCPVQNHNKILEKPLQKKYKIISYFVFNVLILTELFLLYINNNYYDIIIVTLLTVVLMAVVGYYKERRIYNVR